MIKKKELSFAKKLKLFEKHEQWTDVKKELRIFTKIDLRTIADSIFSKIIRIKYSDWREYAYCYTCDKVDEWQNLQCGHYYSRGKMNTRYEERNSRVQCYYCNIKISGNYREYTLRLIKEIGIEKVKEMKTESETLVKITKMWYYNIILKLEKRLEIVIKERK